MSETPLRPDGPVRDNAAWRRYFEHEEKMARALRPTEPSYEIARKSPAGKTSGFEFTITHPDPDEAVRIAQEWDAKFPAPVPVVKDEKDAAKKGAAIAYNRDKAEGK